MALRWKKILTITRKELVESVKNKEVLLIMIFMPMLFAVIMPLTIPLVNVTTPADTIQDDFGSFPKLVPYWDELTPKGQFMVFYSLIYLETFLLLPMILPMTIAADSIAGERERKTMEALLAAPVSSWELLLGKLLTTMIPTVLITWFSGALFMLIADLALYNELGRLLFPEAISSLLLFGLSPFFALIVTQAMIIVSTRTSGMREAQQMGSLIVLPLFFFVLGESALIILFDIYWAIAAAGILLAITVILLVINKRIFKREFMISNIRS